MQGIKTEYKIMILFVRLITIVLTLIFGIKANVLKWNLWISLGIMAALSVSDKGTTKIGT